MNMYLHLSSPEHVSWQAVCLLEPPPHLTLIHLHRRLLEAGLSVFSSLCDELLILCPSYCSPAMTFVLSDVIWSHRIIYFGEGLQCDVFYASPFLGLIRANVPFGKRAVKPADLLSLKMNGLLRVPGCLIDTQWDWFCWIRDEFLWVSPHGCDLWNIIIYRLWRLTSLI